MFVASASPLVADGWVLAAGICGGVSAVACGLTLWFGRRLALYRERTGYVRDEDRALLDVRNDDE